MGAVSSRRREAKEDAKNKVPHKFQAISGTAANPSTDESLEDHISSGSFLSNNRKKYWVDEKTGANCFALVARDLSITWGDDPRYWQWLPMKEAGEVEIEVASLKQVCWLEIHGKLEMSHLTPAVTYDIFFEVMISKETASGWGTPVNLRVKFPDGRVEEHKESLLEKPRGRWIALTVCKLKTRPEAAGEMEISLLECESGQWKRGLIVKGVIVRPTN
ncbi:lectin-like [Musa acuminata AAA Group]|uniref:lectin-like n=1 Tax=Musa acuminata AAA Group TaxID=214697 RepID=UPI0031D3F440